MHPLAHGDAQLSGMQPSLYCSGLQPRRTLHMACVCVPTIDALPLGNGWLYTLPWLTYMDVQG